MRTIFAVAAAGLALLGNWPASAADVAINKALTPRPRVLLTYQGCGTYYGLHTFATAARQDVSGTAGSIGTPFVATAAVGAQLGYICGDGTSWKGVEGAVHYMNRGEAQVATGTAVDGAVNSRWGFTAQVMLGGPLATMLDLLPDLRARFPALPQAAPGTLPATNHPYLFAAVHVDDRHGQLGMADGRAMQVRGGVGMGVFSELGQSANNPNGARVVAKTWVEYIPASKGISLSGADGSSGSANSGTEVRIGTSLNW